MSRNEVGPVVPGLIEPNVQTLACLQAQIVVVVPSCSKSPCKDRSLALQKKLENALGKAQNFRIAIDIALGPFDSV